MVNPEKTEGAMRNRKHSEIKKEQSRMDNRVKTEGATKNGQPSENRRSKIMDNRVKTRSNQE